MILRLLVSVLAIALSMLPAWLGGTTTPNWIESAEVANLGQVVLDELSSQYLDIKTKDNQLMIYTRVAPDEVAPNEVFTVIDRIQAKDQPIEAQSRGELPASFHIEDGETHTAERHRLSSRGAIENRYDVRAPGREGTYVLQGEASARLAMQAAQEEPGSADLELDLIVNVEGDGSDGEPNFEVMELVGPSTVSQGSSATFFGTIANTGEVGGSATFDFRVNGERIRGSRLELASGGTRMVSASYTFSQSGDHRLSLVVGNDAEQLTVTVMPPQRNHPPVALFSHDPTTTKPDKPITFDGSASEDPDGSIEVYRWDFGDGTTVSQQSPIVTHKYEKPGHYWVTLTVRDDRGAEMSSFRPLAVEAEETPVARPFCVRQRELCLIGVGLIPIVVNQLIPQLEPPQWDSTVDAADVVPWVSPTGMAFFPVNQLLIAFPPHVNQGDVQHLMRVLAPGSVITSRFPPINGYLIRFPEIDRLLRVTDKVERLNSLQAKFERWVPQGAFVIKNYLGWNAGQNTGEINTEQLRRVYETLKLPQAWNLMNDAALNNEDDETVEIAIIDSGIQADHREFENVLKVGRSYVKQDGVRQDWWTDTSDSGHGTGVSGLIGAMSGNGGIDGVLSPVTDRYHLVIYKTMLFETNAEDVSYSGSDEQVRTYLKRTAPDRHDDYEALKEATAAPLSSVLHAISNAAENGYSIVNISSEWDKESFESDKQDNIKIVYDIFQTYMESYEDLLFVTAAGNGEGKSKPVTERIGFSLTGKVHAPGGVEASNNITVAATDVDGQLIAPFSNYKTGFEASEMLAAPGVGVLTTHNSSDYPYVSKHGTSFSTPLVAGIAALVRTLDPNRSPTEIRQLLLESASTETASLMRLVDACEAVGQVLVDTNQGPDNVEAFCEGNS